MSELWLKKEKVLTFRDEGMKPISILKVDNPELLPIPLREKSQCTMENVLKWMDGRNIPQHRDGLADLKKRFGDEWLKNKNYASLSDQYWLKWRSETWDQINFFTNSYSTDIGNLFFFPWSAEKKKYSTNSPDLTTNGILKKRWLQKGEHSYLVKAGCRKACQEPINEVLVSVLLEKLGVIPYVRYDLHVEGVTMCSISKNFINKSTMLVTASDIYYTEPRDTKNSSVYNHLLRMCDKFEIPHFEDYINGQIFIDKLTGNEDRNLGNIAFIYNVDKKKFEGPAPIFDSGNAYWNMNKILGNEISKSKIFGDVEKMVFEKIKKRCHIERIFAPDSYEAFRKTIINYPCYSETHKSNLINAIKKRNEILCSNAADEMIL